MDVDGQSIFTDCKIKPETDDTKQSSSPADGSDPFFYFFKVLSIFSRKQRRSHST